MKVFTSAQEERIREIIAAMVLEARPDVEAVAWASRPPRPAPSANPMPRYDEAAVRVLPDGRVDRKNAALFLGREPKTLAEWSRLGKGPVPRNVGGRIFYYLRDLEAFRDMGGCDTASYGGPIGGNMQCPAR